MDSTFVSVRPSVALSNFLFSRHRASKSCLASCRAIHRYACQAGVTYYWYISTTFSCWGSFIVNSIQLSKVIKMNINSYMQPSSVTIVKGVHSRFTHHPFWCQPGAITPQRYYYALIRSFPSADYSSHVDLQPYHRKRTTEVLLVPYCGNIFFRRSENDHKI